MIRPPIWAIPLILVIGYFVAYFTVPPSFSATAQKQPDGDYRIDIDPNFVVFSVYTITASDATGVLAKREKRMDGPQHIIIPGATPTGTTVSVTCDLVYDRPMPSITTYTVEVQLP
ncbi:MAG: hypothetical protein AAF288_06205 [Planctomycetota bacterium]